MKVIGFQSDTCVIASIKVEELAHLAGYQHGTALTKALHAAGSDGTGLRNELTDLGKRTLMDAGDIRVSGVFQDAKETLQAYSELKSKLESVRNQLATLTKKMLILSPEE